MVGIFRTINSALKWRAAILRRRKAALNRHDPLSHATPRGLVCWRDDPAAALAKIDYHCRNQPVSREANVNRGTFFRRHFLKLMAAAGAIGLPAVRWLKVNAATWNGDTATIGIYGSSSGGHVAELIAMRPHDPRYNAIPLAAAPSVDATVAYAATRSPISNTFARYENAVRRGNESMIKNNKVFFNPWETIHEANPQEILAREEKATLVPFLIMQGALDDNVLPEA